MNEPQTSSDIQIAVMQNDVTTIKQDVRDMKQSLSGGYVTLVQHKADIEPIKRLVYWMLGIFGTISVGLVLAVVGLAVNNR